jgi:cellulose synthase operon protein C
VFAAPRVTLIAEATGAMLGIGEGEGTWALAMRLRWAPTATGTPRVLVEDARSTGLAMPSHEAALLAVTACLGGVAKRWGSFFTIQDATTRLLQEVLLDSGARIPETTGLSFLPLEHRNGAFRLAMGDGFPAEPTAETSAAVELAVLLATADEALARGQRDEARRLYLAAWEQAPKEPTIARRVAEIDRAEGRPDAGLSMLTTVTPSVSAGPLGAALLREVGDRDGAREAFVRAGETEPFAPLSALCSAQAAALTEHPGERAELLRLALSRAPTVESLRWPRLAVLLELGDDRGAQAEAESVSAIAPAARRFEVTLRLGRTFLERGHLDAAKTWFERALLFSPRSPEALTGLGEALLSCRSFGRATEVLQRAVDAFDRLGQPKGRALLLLGRALVDGSGEFPLAIARVRAIRGDESVAVEARFWEATWLAALGDRAEASLAFVRMIDAEERSPNGSPEKAAQWLAEASRFERRERGDLALAKRHLGLAIQRRPRDADLLAQFRLVARELEAQRNPAPGAAGGLGTSESESAAPLATPPFQAFTPAAAPAERSVTLPAGAAPPVAPGPRQATPMAANFAAFVAEQADEEDENDASLADRLTDRLRGDPTNIEVALELAGALERLGRDLDLLSLLSARIEDGDEETRSLFVPLRRTTLERLARDARADGRENEAELYASMARS